MKVFRSIGNGNLLTPCAITIGNFDGTHLAHQELFREVALLARLHHWKAAALTFDPHPAHVVAPAHAPKKISSHERRLEVMAACGIEAAVVMPFTKELSQMSPEAFVGDILVRGLGVRAIVVGDNFRFGHKHAGDMHLLAELGRTYGFSTHIEPAIRLRGVIVSSTAVRQAITTGRLPWARRLLGRPYSIEGTVVAGHGIGSKQTVPTLNIDTSCEVLPPHGVYITRARDLDDGRQWQAITNIGVRPTFGGETLAIETFLLEDFDGEDPRRISLDLLRRVRDERRFDSPEALRAQILRDVGIAKAYHRRLAKWTQPL